MDLPIIDGHSHCGRQDSDPPQAFEDYAAHARGIAGAVMIPPVLEVYDRYDCDFRDTPYWRERRARANDYLLTVGNKDFEVFPFFFIWNDFAVDRISEGHRGVKWHRHPDEPRYDYDDPKCAEAIVEIRKRKLPVCFEEELDNTMRFIDDLGPGLRVIIPHCGLLNGGYETLDGLGVWARPNIFTDTSLVPSGIISEYVRNHGHERIMFGSDFPFGDPEAQLRKVLGLGFSNDEEKAIMSLNVRRLLADSNRGFSGRRIAGRVLFDPPAT